MDYGGININPQSVSPTSVNPNEHSVTPPKTTSTIRPESSQSPIPIQRSPSQGNSLNSAESSLVTNATLQRRPSQPDLTTQATNATTQPTRSDSNQTDLFPSPHVSSPLSRPPILQTDQALNSSVTMDAASVTMDAASVHDFKPSVSSENVTSPPQAALIAFGVLSGFFLLLTISLLLWRKRQNSKSAEKDTLAVMEENQISDAMPGLKSEKAISCMDVTSTSCSKSGGQYDTEIVSKPIPFHVRPVSLSAKLSKNDRDQNDHMEIGRGLRRLKLGRSISWRSSIASAWATLGLPDRILQNFNMHPCGDASSHSETPDRPVLSSERPVTASSVSDTRTGNSPTISNQNSDECSNHHA